jgi:hypothetical protein
MNSARAYLAKTLPVVPPVLGEIEDLLSAGAPIANFLRRISSLTILEYRAWSAWPLNSGRRFGALLHPFGIISFQDFQAAFERYLPGWAVDCATKSLPATSYATEFPAIGVACCVCAD